MTTSLYRLQNLEKFRAHPPPYMNQGRMQSKIDHSYYTHFYKMYSTLASLCKMRWVKRCCLIVFHAQTIPRHRPSIGHIHLYNALKHRPDKKIRETGPYYRQCGRDAQRTASTLVSTNPRRLVESPISLIFFIMSVLQHFITMIGLCMCMVWSKTS